MSTRHMCYLLAFALLSLSNVGCCGTMGGCGAGIGGQMYGPGCASCGYPEASCRCEATCGCNDVCCETSCGCSDVGCEATCGCSDVCCEASCGCGDIGCGSRVMAPCPILGRCLIMQRLRMAFRNCYGSQQWNYGGCNGCSSEGYSSEWHNDPPCNCQSASTGGHYGGAYGRRAFLAKQHENLSDDLRFAEEDSGPILR